METERIKEIYRAFRKAMDEEADAIQKSFLGGVLAGIALTLETFGYHPSENEKNELCLRI